MKNRSLPKIALAGACLLILVISAAAQLPKETPQQKQERMRWWTEARFGMFIHWGHATSG